MTVVFMFPGQSSRHPEMIERVTRDDPAGAAIVARASEVLGRDLAAHFRATNPDILTRNRDVQIGIFLANHLHLRALEAAGVRAEWSLGLSLGEYNHLVHIGALDFEAALALVAARGEIYDRASGGAMVSVFPIDAVTVETTILRLGVAEEVGIGLYNAPRQQVLSGERAAVERVVAALHEDVLIEAVEIESRIAMHAGVLAPCGVALARELAETPFVRPRLPYVANVRGDVVHDASPAEIRTCLTEHVFRAVRWQACVEAIASQVRNAVFVEVGPRRVLCNMFGRGWMPGRCAPTCVTEPWPTSIHTLVEELHRAGR